MPRRQSGTRPPPLPALQGGGAPALRRADCGGCFRERESVNICSVILVGLNNYLFIIWICR